MIDRVFVRNNKKCLSKQQRIGIIVAFVQVLFVLFWVSRQGSLYWDTFYSFEKTHYITDTVYGNHYINDDKEYSINQWLGAGYVQYTLFVDRRESVFFAELPFLVKTFLKDPYFVLLNAVQAVFSPRQVSRWPGIWLNICSLVISQFALWNVVKKITKDDNKALLAIIMYGFSGMAFSMASYVRFYSFSTMLLMLFVFFHVVLWEVRIENWFCRLLCELVALLCAYLSMRSTQLTLFFYSIFIVIYGTALLFQKQIKNFILYVLPMLCGGGTYIYKNAFYLDMLTNPSEAVDTVIGPARWVMDSYLSLSPSEFINRLAHTFLYMGKYGFGFWPVFLLFIIIFIYTMIKTNGKLFYGTMEKVIFTTFVLFMVVATCFNFYVQTRYTSYIYPILALISASTLVAFINITNKSVYSKIIVGFIVASIVYSSVSGLRVDFVFAKDKEPLQNVRESGIEDVVAIQQDIHNLDAEIIYEAAYNLSADARIMPLMYTDIDEICPSLPDAILLVNRLDFDQTKEFERNGYEIEWQEETYCYRYCYMKR